MLACLILCQSYFHHNRKWRKSLLPSILLLLTILTVAAQFTSTIHLSDLIPGVTPGQAHSLRTYTNFQHGANGAIPSIDRGSAWSKNPPRSPTFAEYHVDPDAGSNSVSDTGLTLRAFLPIMDQNERLLLRSYSGRAGLIDARVRCYRPTIARPRAHWSAISMLGVDETLASTKGKRPYLSW